MFSDRVLFWIACSLLGAVAGIAVANVGAAFFVVGLVAVFFASYVTFAAWNNVQ